MEIEFITKTDLEQLKSELLSEISQLLSKSSPTFKEFLTGKEVKELLGISTGTLQNYRITGKLYYSKVEGKIFYAYADIQKLINENRVKNKFNE